MRVNCSREQCLSVISDYSPTDCNPNAILGEFYDYLDDFLKKARSTDIVILAGDFNLRIGCLVPE